MQKKIAILRGINVGGNRKILMADLNLLCQQLGMREIKTYIQSGNVIFESDIETQELETLIEQSIKERFGFDVPVIVRTAEELVKAIAENPFYTSDADISALHVTFLKTQPASEKLAETNSFSCEPDKFVIKGNAVYIFCTGKYHQSKLTNNFFEKTLQVTATTRNWKTLIKLHELSKS